MQDDVKYPLVFDVRGFSLDDGPGIRTTVFLKGCPLSCAWCHNPESWKAEREMAFYPGLCIGCGDCSRCCPEDAVSMDLPQRIDRSRCSACGRCADVCPSTALKVVGAQFGIEELARQILVNRIFFETSGGGVPFSGGEPTMHMDYLGMAVRRLKQAGLHVALQTSGMFELAEFREKVYPFVDLIQYDIKFRDEERHRKFTGTGNERILENFVALWKEARAAIIPRTPLVPGITAEAENITSIARFLKKQGCSRYELLSYNPGGLAKRTAVGRTSAHRLPAAMMSLREENTWAGFAKKMSMNCVRGGG